MTDADLLDTAPMRVEEVCIRNVAELDQRLEAAEAPFVVRGLVKEWPLVEAGRRSAHEAREYLLATSRDVPFPVSVAHGKVGGRLFYEHSMEMNFRMLRASLREIFEKITLAEQDPNPPVIYLASIDVHNFFVGLHEANHVELGGRDCLASIWMGTPTTIAAHNDFPDNLACVAVGRRRFTLFPPDQFSNLYLGPLDNTPAGRPISMVDQNDPDFDAHPKFRDALRHAQVAELGPGDAIHIPSSWWHHVRGLDPFNVLINYWWRRTPTWLGRPEDALGHAMMSIRDLPEHQKAHWRALFDYYVFHDNAESIAHIPESGRGVLAPLTPETAGQMRASLLRSLSR